MFNRRFKQIALAVICISNPLSPIFLSNAVVEGTSNEIVSEQGDAKPVELDEIVVTPGRFSINDGRPSTISLSKQLIEQFPLVDNDVMRAAHIFPGVVASDYSARFSVRGGEKDDVLVRLDGMELFNPYHLQDFGGAVSMVGLDLIQGVELLMGGFPAEYGDKMSGVFDITTKTDKIEKVSANLGVDLINATAMVEGPLSEKGSWRLSARRGYVDLILALIDLDEDYKPQYADVYGKLTYSPTQMDTITLNGLYGWDKNRIRQGDLETNLDSRYDNLTVWTRWRHRFGTSNWSDVFVFGGSAAQDRRTGTADFDVRSFRFLGAKTELTAGFLDKHQFRSGIEWRWMAAQYDYDVSERQSGVDRYARVVADLEGSGGEFKAYIQDEWQFHPKLALNFGGRYLFQDYRATGIQRYELGPRVALAVRPTEKLVLRGAWGFYHQPILMMNIPVEDGVQTVGRAEQAVHYILGGEYRPSDNFLFRLESYYKTLDNLTGRLREFGRQTQIFAPPESGEAKGVDVFVTHAVSNRLTWGIGYAYAIAKESAGGETFFRQSDRRHSIAVSSSHQLSHGRHLYLTWRFHSGEPRTPLTHTLVSQPGGGIACDRQFGATHSERLPPYHSLDFRFTDRNPYSRWELTWYFQILNLYNRSNLDQYAFSEVRDDETGALLTCEIDEEPLLPILPTLGVMVAF